MNLADDFNQLLWRQVFQKVPSSSRLESPLNLHIAFKGRKHYDSGIANSDRIAIMASIPLKSGSLRSISVTSFQEAVRLADGEAGQQKVLLDFSERAP